MAANPTTTGSSELITAQKLMEAQHYAEALTVYRRALKVAADDLRLHIALGVCLIKLRHWNEAIKALTHGIALKPAYAEADARLYLAESLLAAGQKHKAIEQWKIVAAMPAMRRPSVQKS